MSAKNEGLAPLFWPAKNEGLAPLFLYWRERVGAYSPRLAPECQSAAAAGGTALGRALNGRNLRTMLGARRRYLRGLSCSTR
jgi:hypothetical protein